LKFFFKNRDGNFAAATFFQMAYGESGCIRLLCRDSSSCVHLISSVLQAETESQGTGINDTVMGLIHWIGFSRKLTQP